MLGLETKEKKEKKDIDIDAVYPDREQKEYFSFFSEQTSIAPDYEIRLYRIPPIKSKKTLDLLEIYCGETPHERDIGLAHGGGDYKAIGRKPGQHEPDVRYISLAKELWDRRKEEHERKSMPVMGDNEITSSLNILDRLSQIAARTNGGNGNSNGMGDKSLTGAVQELRTLQIGLIKESVKERSVLYKELKSLHLNPAEPEKLSDNSEEQDTLWNHPLVLEAFENLMDHGLGWLKSTGPKKEMGRKLIKEDPNFQKIANNEDLLLALYNRCKAEDKIGKDVIDKIFQELGMQVQDIPVEEPEKAEEKK